MAESTKNAVAQELQDLAEDLKEVVESEAFANNPKVKALRVRIDELSDQARDVMREAKHKTKCAAVAADQYAHEEPWRLVGAGVAVGVVIGFLLGRK